MYKPDNKRIIKAVVFLSQSTLEINYNYSQLASEKSKDNILTNSLSSSSYNKLSQSLLLKIIKVFIL